jgi:hypothetical protein
MHEDPRARVHQPHPFQHDVIMARKRSISLATESGPMHADRSAPRSPASPSRTQHVTVPGASYLAPGFHDQPLPVGKYYPSNYEQRHAPQREHSNRPSITESASSSFKLDAQSSTGHPSIPTSPTTSESDARRKMQQYQRDMIAQASMLLGNTAKAGAKGTNISAMGLPNKDIRFGAGMPRKPRSPRLAPLGSPGPVTPMDLEGMGCGGYMDVGMSQDRRPMREGIATPDGGFAVHST